MSSNFTLLCTPYPVNNKQDTYLAASLKAFFFGTLPKFSEWMFLILFDIIWMIELGSGILYKWKIIDLRQHLPNVQHGFCSSDENVVATILLSEILLLIIS